MGTLNSELNRFNYVQEKRYGNNNTYFLVSAGCFALLQIILCTLLVPIRMLKTLKHSSKRLTADFNGLLKLLLTIESSPPVNTCKFALTAYAR